MQYDIERSLTYAFEDPEWVTKLGILALAALVPILGTVAMFGYLVQLMRNVAAERTHPLPAWDHAGELLADGVKPAVIFLVYTLPLFVMCGVPFVLFIGAAALSEDRSRAAEALASLGVAALVGLLCLATLYGLVIGLVWPAVLVLYARTRSLAAGFNPGWILGYIRANAGVYFLGWLLTYVIGLVLSVAVAAIGLIPFVSCLAILFYPIIGAATTAITGHLYGQLDRLTAVAETTGTA